MTNVASQRRTSCRGHMDLSQGRLGIRYVAVAAMRRNVNAHGRTNNGTKVRSPVHGVDTRILTVGNLIANMMMSMNAHIAENHSLLRGLSMSRTLPSAALKTCQKDGQAAMISAKERRDIVRKLREPKDSLLAYPDEELIRLRNMVGCRYGQDLYEHLADLIEPQPIDGDTSDGYHTFNELYHHRAVLFSVIVVQFADRVWKSKLHADGTMFEGMFIVGIETPDGQATYHYDVEPYWNLFQCKEVDRAPEWDGHTPDQAIERIGKLIDYKIDRPTCKTVEHGQPDEYHVCKSCSRCSYGWFEDIHDKPYSYCPNCGTEITK